MDIKTKHTVLYKMLILCTTCSSTCVYAQEQLNNYGEEIPSVTFEPIIVEATKGSIGAMGVNDGYNATLTNSATGMNLPFKETPQSSSVVTSEFMQDHGIKSIDDVARHATGITVSTSDSNRLQFQGRGLPITTVIHNGTAITWDNRFEYGDKMLDTAIFERVEVVRGANGLMQGAGTPSAAINMIYKRPTDEFSGEVNLGIGNHDKKIANVDVSGPITSDGELRGRAVYAYQEGGDGWLDRAENKQNTLYGIVEADITPDTTITLSGMHQNKDAEASMSGGLPLFYSDGSRTNFDRSVNTAPKWATYESRINNGTASIEHYFNNDWRLKGSYNYNKAEIKQPTLWPTGNPDPITNKGMQAGSLYFIDGERKQHTFDINLNGNFELANRQHELIAGAQHWKQTFNNPYYGAKPPLGLPYKGRNLNPDNPLLGDITNPNFKYPNNEGYPTEPEWDFSKVAINGVMNLEGETKQSSAYLASNLSLNDQMKLLVGGRLDNWKTNQTNFGTKSDYKVDDEFTPYLGLTYALNDNVSAYANYTSIFTPQSQLDKNGEVLEPIDGKNYEVGLKSTLFKDSLNASVAAFNIKQDNVAVLDGVISGTGQSAYRSQDGTETKGWEAEVSGAVTPEWNIYSSYTRAETKDPEGKQLHTTSPKNIFKLFTTYDLSRYVKGLTVGGGVYWQDDIYRENVNNPINGKVTVKQDDYAVYDLMARYEINDKTSLNLNLNNIFDKKYYTQLGMYDQYYYGEPRNILVSLKYDF